MTGNPIELHVDLDVEPRKERDLESTFHTVFQPTIVWPQMENNLKGAKFTASLLDKL